MQSHISEALVVVIKFNLILFSFHFLQMTAYFHAVTQHNFKAYVNALLIFGTDIVTLFLCEIPSPILNYKSTPSLINGHLLNIKSASLCCFGMIRTRIVPYFLTAAEDCNMVDLLWCWLLCTKHGNSPKDTLQISLHPFICSKQGIFLVFHFPPG